jgi:hypothetical protein
MSVDAETEINEAPPLWRVLDLALEAHAIAVDCDAEVASFVLMSVFVLGERLALSDEVLDRMLMSATAEKRWQRKLRS